MKLIIVLYNFNIKKNFRFMNFKFLKFIFVVLFLFLFCVISGFFRVIILVKECSVVRYLDSRIYEVLFTIIVMWFLI